MEEKNQVFNIPLDEYEEDIDKKLSRDKKKEIIELLTNHNHLRSKLEYDETEFKLHEACQNGDLELIEICLSETIENETKDLKYKINKAKKTASLFKISNKQIEHLIIPRTVKHESDEYLITSVSWIGCVYFPVSHIKTIKFSEDSSVSTIYSNSFSYSLIEEIYFPKSLKELKEKWCYETTKLKKIEISPSNDQFLLKDDIYLICKSDEFDTFLFACRDIKTICFPTNIKTISSYACSYSKIEEVFIPPSVTKINEGAFYNCKNLKKIEIPTDSNLQIIERNAFYNTKIEEIHFPKSLKELKEGWCGEMEELKRIKISPLNNQFIFKDKYLIGKNDIESDVFDIFLFACRDIKTICIPTNIKIISPYSFSYSKIEEVFIPPSVIKISYDAFYNCKNLKKVEIPTDSNLQIIERNAFYNTKFEEIYFPKSLKELKQSWCCSTHELKRIKISPLNSQFIFKDQYLIGKSDNKSDEFDTLLFASRDIKTICIPTNIKIISSYAFSYSTIEEIFIPPNVLKICFCAFFGCKKLKKIEIPTNSKLHIIEKQTFLNSQIEEIFIPPNVIRLCEGTFANCKNLKKVEIPENSNLQIIDQYAFIQSSIEEIYLPKNLLKLKQSWCSGTKKLKKIKISPLNNQFMFKDQYLIGKSDIKSDEFDTILFASRDIKTICIPTNIKTITSHSFSFSKIEEIHFPSNVSRICKYSFYGCTDLKKVNIPTNSNFHIIEASTFSNTKIKEIFIPPNVSKICKNAFEDCVNLKIVEISDESKIQSISPSVFSNCSNAMIMISPSLKIRFE